MENKIEEVQVEEVFAEEVNNLPAEIKNLVPASLSPDMTMGSIQELGRQVAETKFFPVKNAEEASGILLMAKDLNIGPAVALNHIFMVQKKPTLSANLIKALVIKSGVMHWRVIDKWKEIYDEEGNMIDVETIIEFSYVPAWARKAPNPWDYIERTEWKYTWSEAEATGNTGKDVWQKYSRAMMLKSCFNEGIRHIDPSVTMGLYSFEEMALANNMDIAVDGDGEVMRPFKANPNL